MRRKIELLNSLKTKIEQVQKERSDADRREALLRESQVQFDKYLRLYAKDSRSLRRQKRDFYVDEQVELATFKQKWANYLVEEHENADDIRPMLGLDTHDPHAKPYKIFSRTNVAQTI